MEMEILMPIPPIILTRDFSASGNFHPGITGGSRDPKLDIKN